MKSSVAVSETVTPADVIRAISARLNNKLGPTRQRGSNKKDAVGLNHGKCRI